MVKKFYKHYWDTDLKHKVSENTDLVAFDSHCQEVADQLGISKHVVKSVLKDYAFYVLRTIQEKTINRILLKINIFGYFSFQTNNNKFKFIRT